MWNSHRAEQLAMFESSQRFHHFGFGSERAMEGSSNVEESRTRSIWFGFGYYVHGAA
jgi:hypothetical protein